MTLRMAWVTGIAAAVVLITAGCWRDVLLDGREAAGKPGPIQQIVEAKIEQQRASMSGPERWEQFRKAEYQSQPGLVRGAEQLAIDKRRRAVARRLTGAGPLVLTDCLAFALEFNPEIQGRRAAIQAVKGEEVVARSRFLPHLVYGLDHQAVRPTREKEEEEEEEFTLPPLFTPTPEPTVTADPKGTPALAASGGGDSGDESGDGDAAAAEPRWRRSTDQVLLLTQTLIEFGKDNPQDVDVRDSQRDALFDYEASARRTVSAVRLKFFTILLRQRQVTERRKLLAEFRARYEQMRELEKSRRVLEVDVLTARLNMLNEEARINALEKEVLRQKIDLSNLMGLPVGMTDFDVRGEQERFDLSLDDAVDVALRRSTRIAEGRAAVWEQERVVRQLIWEYAPDLRLQGGWRDKSATAGLELAEDDDTFGLSMFGEKQLDGVPVRGFDTSNDILGADERGWYVGVFLELQILDGLERKGRFIKERALLEQGRHDLRSTVYAVDADVRKAYQTVLERRKELEIQRETVQIARERLRVQERLKELGKVSDNELETFRTQFFREQDDLFKGQIDVVDAQESLRFAMRYFEPLPRKGKWFDASP